jgi:hypothetical protein
LCHGSGLERIRIRNLRLRAKIGNTQGWLARPWVRDNGRVAGCRISVRRIRQSPLIGSEGCQGGLVGLGTPGRGRVPADAALNVRFPRRIGGYGQFRRIRLMSAAECVPRCGHSIERRCRIA